MILRHPLRIVFAEVAVMVAGICVILAVTSEARARVKGFVPRMEAGLRH